MDQFKKQESLKPYFAKSYGCCVFETIAKAGFGVGGAGGKGAVYLLKDGTEELVGHSTMFQLSFGFQLGGQMYSEIIFFETEPDYKHFISDNFEFGAEANVVALTASAKASISTLGNQGVTAGVTAGETKVPQTALQYTKGMAVFTITLGGLMYEATVKGQRFHYMPLTAATDTM
ncbi:Las17-binding protein actin regulator [Nitzschia inconspicua]|uniref:Las17-binding protein actin regulator n=1 Tax=Nitzschia inconspicua TaxID=303405 RepID=A0A9K3PZB3_9STRA|nr:Las17-binding protein actin regulator [Nitzschia inconspicua]